MTVSVGFVSFFLPFFVLVYERLFPGMAFAIVTSALEVLLVSLFSLFTFSIKIIKKNYKGSIRLPFIAKIWPSFSRNFEGEKIKPSTVCISFSKRCKNALFRESWAHNDYKLSNFKTVEDSEVNGTMNQVNGNLKIVYHDILSCYCQK